MLRRFHYSSLVLFALLLLQGSVVATRASVLFKVDVSSAVSTEPVSGRLLIFITQSSQPLDVVQPSLMELDKVWVSAKEVRNLVAGTPVTLDADVLSYPAPFSSAKPGDYQVMALLDVDHSFTYSEIGPGDLRSAVINVKNFSEPIGLTLTRRVEDEHPTVDTDSIKLITFKSSLLSAFWGRPITMKAGVVLPPSYATSRGRYPVVYKIHGFGGSYRGAWQSGPGLLKKMAAGTQPEMIYVYLDGFCPMGHHEFADSPNNGPWGSALTKEFVPYLERMFRMDRVPGGRFLTGHSSGGWSTLWLQVNYPDFFGGTWSTSPDPVDFHSFSGIDLTQPQASFYRDPNGKARNIVRFHGKDILSWNEYARYERVVGDYGGQLASFEAVFSPRGQDGRPMEIFDRDTGAVNPVIQKAWERYDISRFLVSNWKTLAPKLRGKIHLVVGTVDNFHLEEAVYLLRDTLRKLGSDATFEVVEGRDHFDLYNGDLADRIARDMYKKARPAAKTKN